MRKTHLANTKTYGVALCGAEPSQRLEKTNRRAQVTCARCLRRMRYSHTLSAWVRFKNGLPLHP